MNQLQKQHPVR